MSCNYIDNESSMSDDVDDRWINKIPSYTADGTFSAIGTCSNGQSFNVNVLQPKLGTKWFIGRVSGKSIARFVFVKIISRARIEFAKEVSSEKTATVISR